MLNFNLLNQIKTHLPFFIFDIQNKILITTETIPGDMTDTRGIYIMETQVPGLDFSPISVAGTGNRKVSFTIPVIKRNNTLGNTLTLAQFMNLRTKAGLVSSLYSAIGTYYGFVPTPKVLFYYGVGVPTIWYVAKCDFVHKTGWINAVGNTQYTDVQIELWEDHTHWLAKMEELYRRLAAYAGIAESMLGISPIGNKRTM